MNGTSVLSKPYKVYVLKTEHFDILFPKQSMKTAQIIEQNIETLYQKALQSLESNVKLHIPILISPDSDEFSVTYTPNPYNRIIVFEAYPGFAIPFENEVILTQLYEEVFRAIKKKKKSGLNTFIANTIGGSSYQPVAQLNMPFSFIQGFSSISQSFSKLSENKKKDSNLYFSSESEDDCKNETYEFQEQKQLELLVQAKIEGKFPSHFQARVSNDIYPYNQIIFAATAGFSAYLL